MVEAVSLLLPDVWKPSKVRPRSVRVSLNSTRSGGGTPILRSRQRRLVERRKNLGGRQLDDAPSASCSSSADPSRRIRNPALSTETQLLREIPIFAGGIWNQGQRLRGITMCGLRNHEAQGENGEDRVHKRASSKWTQWRRAATWASRHVTSFGTAWLSLRVGH